MGQISLTFPDSTYTSANKPSVETLKTDISAIETAVNANQTLAVETTDTDVSANSWVLDEDAMGSDSNQKVPTQQSVKAYVDAAITATKEALYPVGSIYVNESVATNPATLLGFGTWVAYGAGRVIVGKAGSGTFDTAGEELGAETVTLTGAQSGEKGHNHTQNAHGHKVTIQENRNSQSDSSTGRKLWNDSTIVSLSSQPTVLENTTATNIAVAASNAAEAHSNLQPSITAYMWKRTS